MASTGAEVISLAAKLFNPGDARDKAVRVNEELVRKIRTETNVSEDRVIAGRNGAPSRYHGVLQSTRDTAKAANERNASYSDI